jgi:toxin-antitoxin system PIN domain toxin
MSRRKGQPAAALLDTNVLLALAWPNHQHHATAHAWFGRHARAGWATCALTQLGFIRLSSNPAYTPSNVTPAEAASLLHEMILHPAHEFWPSPTAADPTLFSYSLGHQQVNDAWLVDVVRRRSGRLVTFDARISVHGGETAAVEVIG